MKKYKINNMYLKLIGGVLLLEISIFVLIIILCKQFNIDKEVETALITQVGGLLTFIGSLVGIGLTLDSNIKQKRAENVLNTKLNYYHRFCEAYVKKCSYINHNDTKEAIESNMEFVKEVNRLPLYSSEEIVNFMEFTKNTSEEIYRMKKEYISLLEQLKVSFSKNECEEFINLLEKTQKFKSDIEFKEKSIQDNDFGKLYKLIRDDLNNDSFDEFTDELKATLTIPDKIPSTTSNQENENIT